MIKYCTPKYFTGIIRERDFILSECNLLLMISNHYFTLCARNFQQEKKESRINKTNIFIHVINGFQVCFYFRVWYTVYSFNILDGKLEKL